MPVWFKQDRGQALVELALILPVVLLLLTGMIEGGRIFHAYLTVVHAAREGARTAAVVQDDSVVVQRVQKAAPSLPADELEIEINPVASSRRRGEPVQVSVQYGVHLVLPLISAIIPDPVRVRGQTIMRVE